MRKKALEIILVCLFFLLLALIDTYPLVRHLDRGMPYFPYPDKGYEITYMSHGDYLQLYYNLWLFKDALSGNIPFFSNPYEFSAGEGYMPSFNTQFLPMSFFFAILSIFGDITAYNLLVILSYILAGTTGYLLVKLYTRSWIPSLLAGIIFALFPYRTGEVLGGHPNGFLFFLIPLTIYLIERSFKHSSILASSGAGLCLIAMSLLENHLQYYTFLFVSFFLPWRLFFPLHEWSEEDSQAEQASLIKGLRIKDIIIVFLSGSVVGISMMLIKSSGPILKDPVFYTSVAFPFILFLFWVIYSRFFSLAAGIPTRQSLKGDAFTYLPLMIFVLYLLRLLYPIEHLGKGLTAIALFSIIALKGYRLFKAKDRLLERFNKTLPSLKQRLYKTIIPILLIFLLTVVWVLYTRSTLEVSIAAGGRPITQIMKYSPEIGNLFMRHNTNSAKNIYIGVIPFLLSCMSIFMLKREVKRDVFFFGAVFIISLILSFGPNLAPYINLYTFLYNHLPFFNYPRVAGRMITVTIVMAGILSGYGVKWLITSSPSPQSSPPGGEGVYKKESSPLRGEGRVRGRHLLIGFIFIVILLDFLPFKFRGISIVSRGNTVYEEIRKNLGDKKVLEIPLWPGDSAWTSIYQYYVTLYRYKMINGYDPGVSKRYIDEIFGNLYPLDFGELKEKEYSFLNKLNVKYIVMHEEEFPRKVSPFPFRSSLDNMKRSPYVTFIKKDGLIYLFKLNDEVKTTEIPSFSINSPIGSVYQSERLPRLTGSVVNDEDASVGAAAVGREGEGEGWLQYGPYSTFPSGEYKAIFRMKIDKRESGREVTTIDIASRMSKKVLNKMELKTDDFIKGGVYQDFTLLFSLKSPQELEFRVYYKNNADLYVDYAYILTAGEKDPRWTYSSEDLFRLPDRIEGPTRRYPKGDYIATFYLKTGQDKESGDVADISVLQEGIVLVKKSLKSQDFRRDVDYTSFSLKFNLFRDAFVDFKISSKDMTKVSLKKIEIRKEDN